MKFRRDEAPNCIQTPVLDGGNGKAAVRETAAFGAESCRLRGAESWECLHNCQLKLWPKQERDSCVPRGLLGAGASTRDVEIGAVADEAKSPISAIPIGVAPF